MRAILLIFSIQTVYRYKTGGRDEASETPSTKGLATPVFSIPGRNGTLASEHGSDAEPNG